MFLSSIGADDFSSLSLFVVEALDGYESFDDPEAFIAEETSSKGVCSFLTTVGRSTEDSGSTLPSAFRVTYFTTVAPLPLRKWIGVYKHSNFIFVHFLQAGFPSSHFTLLLLQLSQPFFDLLWNLRLPVDVVLTFFPSTSINSITFSLLLGFVTDFL